MKLNPEFCRNLWLEWSIHRVVFVVGVLTGVFVLARLFGTNNVVANAALATFILTAVLWGAHRAADSMIEELRERTWDSQRMSALDPWSMTWGKLAGATVIPWFAGFISLAVYVLEKSGPSAWERVQVAILCIAGAILVQSLSLIGALVGTHLEKHGRSTLTSWAAVGAIVLLSIYFANYLRTDDVIVWYGGVYERFDFLCLSLVTLSIWFTHGAYRCMCTELAVATRPWVWLSFVVFLIVYATGGVVPLDWQVTQVLSVATAIGLAVCGLASYIAAFARYRDPLSFRRLKIYALANQWRRFFEELPIWIVSMALGTFFVLACSALHFTPSYSAKWVEHIGFSAIAIWLLAVRDIAILYFFTYGDARKRVETSTIICLALLYWLLPCIIESVGFVKTSWLLRPPIEDRPILSAVIIAVHVAIAGTLAVQRYRRRIAPNLSAS